MTLLPTHALRRAPTLALALILSACGGGTDTAATGDAPAQAAAPADPIEHEADPAAAGSADLPGGFGAGDAVAAIPGFPSVGTAFEARGPLAVSVRKGTAHTYYYPTGAATGIRHPVVLWGNGTGTSPSTYDALLRHWASHGFIVAAANTSNAMSGTEMLAGLDQLVAFDKTQGDVFFGRIDASRVAASGHSQGAYGAVAAANDARVKTAVPLEGGGYARNTRASMLFLAGGADTIVAPANVRRAYQYVTGAPAVYAELKAATHFTAIGNAGGFRGVTTAWLRWALAEDSNGAPTFVGASCTLCTSADWVFERNAAFQSAHPSTGTPPTPPTTPTEPTTPPPTTPPAEPPVPQPPTTPATGFPSVGTAFGARGSFAVTVDDAAEHSYYRPATLGANGLRHPVILWGNGTGTTPSAYDALLRHWASHGFIVAAAKTSSAMSGAEMLRGLDQLTTFNGTASSVYYGKVDLTRVGTSGHSQGAFGAVAAARDPRIRTAAPLQGGGTSIGSTASVLFFAGSNDTIVSPTLVRSAYSRATRARAAYAELQGATHFEGTYSGGNFRPAATAWLRWQLTDDANAKPLFTGAACGLCTDASWKFERNASFQSAWPL